MDTLQKYLASKNTVSIDWLQFVVSLSPTAYPSFLDFCLVNDVPLESYAGTLHGRKYDSITRTVRGAIIAYSVADTGYECWVSFPGSWLGQLAYRDIWRLCLGLRHKYNVRCTRFDIALDDYTKSLDPLNLRAAIAKNQVARFRADSCSWIESPATPGKGWTLYLGAAQSDKRARYYDKATESKGKIDAWRFEVQLRARRAEQIFSTFMSLPNFNEQPEDDVNPSVALEFLKDSALGVFDFIERVDKNLDRGTRLKFWEEFLFLWNSIPYRARLETVSNTFEKKKQWLFRQVAGTLSLAKRILKDQFFNYVNVLVREGDRKFNRTLESIYQQFLIEQELQNV